MSRKNSSTTGNTRNGVLYAMIRFSARTSRFGAESTIRPRPMPRPPMRHHMQPVRCLFADIHPHVLDLAVLQQILSAFVD